MKIKNLLIVLLGATSIIACNSGTSTSGQGQSLNTTTLGASGLTCDGIAQWDATKIYEGTWSSGSYVGVLVVRDGNEYVNNYWTKGDDPLTHSGEAGSAWTLVSKCGVPAPSPVPTPTAIPTPTPESVNLPTPLTFEHTSTANGLINFHLNLPYGSGNIEKLTLTNNYTDLIISNYVAGALLGHMIHVKYPKLNYNRDYIYGTLFGQLLQENIDTSNYESTTDWINPVAVERNTLLNPGQGGPYQINDYAKRVEGSKADGGLGLVNYAAIQKGLGFTIEAQDDLSQSGSKGPSSLDQKYFGPLAAAYFHFNDIARAATTNSHSYGPQYAYYDQCMKNLEKSSSTQSKYNILDLILNAEYNAGTYSVIYTDYFRICAGMYSTEPEMTQLSSVGDYSLSDAQYQVAIGTKQEAQGTFLIYPRQIRIYLDEIYNQHTFPSGAFSVTNEVNLSVHDIEYVFENVLGTTAYVNEKKEYNYIPYSEIKKAFEEAIASKGISVSGSLNISTPAGKTKFFDLLDAAINNLAKNLNIDFTKTTEENLGSGAGPTPTPTPANICPTNPQAYPDGAGAYKDGTIVKGSDGNLYKCNNGLSNWCNGDALAYDPVTGRAGSLAWTLYQCEKK